MVTQIAPDSLTMASLCNADEAATGNIDRSRYVVNQTVKVEPYGWNRCSGGSLGKA